MNTTVTTDRQCGLKLSLTYRETAEALGVCERAVWQLVRDGQLPALRIGRSVRIPLSAIHDFIEVNTGRP